MCRALWRHLSSQTEGLISEGALSQPEEKKRSETNYSNADQNTPIEFQKVKINRTYFKES